MALRFALMIDPAASDDPRTDFAATFWAIDPASPALQVGDLSSQRGDGIFETLGVVDRHPQHVEAHLRRLAHSAELLELPAPHLEQWRQATAAAAAACPADGEGYVRLVLSRGVDGGPAPTAWATASAAPDHTDARRDGIRVVTLDRGMDSGAAQRAPWLVLGAKTLSYAVNMAALREARRRGADDALFVSSDGIVLEAPTSSIVLRIGDRFTTPVPNGGILHGTTQRSVFDMLAERGFDTAYESIPASALQTADAAWLLSSVRLAAPICDIDGRRIEVDRALTADLNAYLRTPRD